MTLTLAAVTMRDAAYPNSFEPDTSAELIYIGGDTPNPKTPASSSARYKVPCWVRSNPQTVDVTADATACINLLRRYQVPAGVVTILDLEEAIAWNWVLTYGTILRNAGYLVWPYGSTGQLFRNPELDGYFVGDPWTPPAPHLWPGSAATQWGWFAGYDLSIIAAGQSLWDTAPPPQPPPPPPPNILGPAYRLPGDDTAMIVPFSTTTGSDGTAYVPIAIPAGCTRVLGGWADVMAAAAVTPPHHDGDITAADPTGVNCQPAVGVGIAPALRISAGIPNHFYTGRAICG